MAEAKEPTKPRLWEGIKSRLKAQGKGGAPGQWSARKSQLALLAYNKAGGGWKKTAPGGSRQAAPMKDWG